MTSQSGGITGCLLKGPLLCTRRIYLLSDGTRTETPKPQLVSWYTRRWKSGAPGISPPRRGRGRPPKAPVSGKRQRCESRKRSPSQTDEASERPRQMARYTKTSAAGPKQGSSGGGYWAACGATRHRCSSDRVDVVGRAERAPGGLCAPEEDDPGGYRAVPRQVDGPPSPPYVAGQ